MKDKIFIVMAALNEEKRIGSVITDLKKKGFNDIVVVDDGSVDKTASVADRAGAHVVSHVINRGQGAALRTGMDVALENGADIIVHFDADGQHSSNEIKKMVSPILKNECEVTIGSRFLTNKSNVPFIRKVGLKSGIVFMNIFYGVKMTDAQNGFRAISKNAAKKLEIKSDREEHASAIVDEIHRKNISFKEVPVTIKYTDYSVGKGPSTLKGFEIGAKLIMKKIFR